MKDMKIVTSLKDSSLLIKGVSETIENETKEQGIGFISMLIAKVHWVQTYSEICQQAESDQSRQWTNQS